MGWKCIEEDGKPQIIGNRKKLAFREDLPKKLVILDLSMSCITFDNQVIIVSMVSKYVDIYLVLNTNNNTSLKIRNVVLIDNYCMHFFRNSRL